MMRQLVGWRAPPQAAAPPQADSPAHAPPWLGVRIFSRIGAQPRLRLTARRTLGGVRVFSNWRAERVREVAWSTLPLLLLLYVATTATPTTTTTTTSTTITAVTTTFPGCQPAIIATTNAIGSGMHAGSFVHPIPNCRNLFQWARHPLVSSLPGNLQRAVGAGSAGLSA